MIYLERNKTNIVTITSNYNSDISDDFIVSLNDIVVPVTNTSNHVNRYLTFELYGSESIADGGIFRLKKNGELINEQPFRMIEEEQNNIYL